MLFIVFHYTLLFHNTPIYLTHNSNLLFYLDLQLFWFSSKLREYMSLIYDTHIILTPGKDY